MASVDRVPEPAGSLDDEPSDEELVRASLRINTLILGIVFGILASVMLAALGLLANVDGWNGPLIVSLLGVFLPGYGRTGLGPVIGAVWGFAIGGSLGALIYRLHGLHVLGALDDLVVAQRAEGDFPRAVLRLHGPALGLAIGVAGGLGLVVTTNMLVLRGTADESVHARLLAEVLPGYSVTPLGSLVGGLELFGVLYLLCALFVAVYNAVAARRHAAARPA